MLLDLPCKGVIIRTVPCCLPSMETCVLPERLWGLDDGLHSSVATVGNLGLSVQKQLCTAPAVPSTRLFVTAAGRWHADSCMIGITLP